MRKHLKLLLVLSDSTICLKSILTLRQQYSSEAKLRSNLLELTSDEFEKRFCCVILLLLTVPLMKVSKCSRIYLDQIYGHMIDICSSQPLQISIQTGQK